ncbi:YoaP domain-containing protein [Streptococcus infantarius]|uniref:YoaP domain-containing protein n=1 Tax=Streptococcus infantarius TaxID=102684 RepID=UPI00349F883C
MSFKAIQITDRKTAQAAPTPITTYAFFYNREYVTNEQMNAKKNLKLVSKVKG